MSRALQKLSQADVGYPLQMKCPQLKKLTVFGRSLNPYGQDVV